MKTIIFGGATEGREQAVKCASGGESVIVCVTSAYARELLPPGIPCHMGAMNQREMIAFLSQEHPDRVLDATHPFAVQATKNIQGACEALRLPYQRTLRENDGDRSWRELVKWVEDAQAAAKALEKTTGRILLTTGSHTLPAYCAALPVERLYARVLPTSKALLDCEALGLPPGHVLAMQGPFTPALNAALYDQLQISVMVTKDSGKPGGVTEKVLPALERGIHVIVICKPREERLCAEKA